MKRGCFIKSIVILTIFVAAIAYIIQYKLDEWIIEPGKKLLLPQIEKGFEKEFEFVTESAEKDSMLSLLGDFIRNLNFKQKSDSGKIEFWEQVNKIVSDSNVTFSEIDELKKILEIKNEESK